MSKIPSSVTGNGRCFKGPWLCFTPYALPVATLPISGGYLNSGPGKDFQKLMFFKKEKEA